jgi:hypothetical protein
VVVTQRCKTSEVTHCSVEAPEEPLLMPSPFTSQWYLLVPQESLSWVSETINLVLSFETGFCYVAEAG